MGRLLILLLAFGGADAPAAGQEKEPVFRAEVRLVKVDVQVLSGGKVVTGLAASDFRVWDEGAPQEVIYFARDREPVWLVLLLDISGSVQRYLRQITASAQRALEQMGEGDQVALIVFTREAKLWEGFQDNWPHLAKAIQAAAADRSMGAGTAINPSIISAAQYISDRAGAAGRRSILIVTDNQGLNYLTPDDMVLRELYAADAVLNAIVVGKAEPPRPPPPGEYRNPDFTVSDVFKLAAQSGGEVLRASETKELTEVLARLRTRYSLHYRPPEAAKAVFRRIRVELSPEAQKRYPRAVVRARAGYYAKQ